MFVGIAVSDYEKAVKEFAQKIGVTYPMGIDPTGQIADEYRTISLPTTFIIDREGNEVRKFGIANEAVLRLFLRGQLGGE